MCIAATLNSKEHKKLTTVMPKMRTKANEPNPMTMTAMAQSGKADSSSGLPEAPAISFASTVSKKKYYYFEINLS
jgi:hypothetical protein